MEALKQFWAERAPRERAVLMLGGFLLLALLVWLIARRRPCASPHRDLDFIATLCGAGLIWFFVGETIGPSALSFYNLGMAGMALGLWILPKRQT